MPKDASRTIKICDWATKYAIYALVFLLPILFFPWTTETLDFNKQTALVFLVFIAFFAWMLKVLVLGRFQINSNKIHIFVGILFLAFLLSTIFSVDKYGSFWGWPRVTAESLLSIIGLVVFYFIVSNAFSKKEFVRSLYIFSVSALIAEIFGVLQLFGLFIMPFNFAKNVAFNTVGGAGALGVFAAVLLPLTIVLLIYGKKWAKLLFSAEIALSALLLILVNYPAVWWMVVLGSALIMILGVFKRNLFDGRWMALPMFFLAVSLFFVVLNPQLNWLLQKTNEISLSEPANFQVDIQALKENPIFGSGPGTFSYDFSKFKSSDFSKTVLWSVIFNNGNSKILTDLATIGGLGFLAIIALLASIIFYGGKYFFTRTNDFEQYEPFTILSLGLFISLVVEILAYFLRNSNLTLDFTFFIMLAILAGLIFEQRRKYELKPSSLLTLIVTFVFTLIFIFGLGILFLDGQRYVAEISYSNGLSALALSNIDEGIKGIEAAIATNSGTDLYFRQLAQIYLLKIQDVLKDQSKSQDDKSKIAQVLVSNSINAAKIASDLGPKNAVNWLVRGYVYQNLAGLVTDADTWALNSYNEAQKLDPSNPYVFVQKGIVYFQKKDYQNAKDNFQKALDLKPDYQAASDGIKAVNGASQQGPESVAPEPANKKLPPAKKK